MGWRQHGENLGRSTEKTVDKTIGTPPQYCHERGRAVLINGAAPFRFEYVATGGIPITPDQPIIKEYGIRLVFAELLIY